MNDPIRLSISGMSCAGCAAAVEDALRGVSGVAEAKVNLFECIAQVEGTAVTDELIAAVKQAGYDAVELKSAEDQAAREMNHYRRLLKQAAVALLVGVCLMLVGRSEQLGLGILIPPLSNTEGQVFWLLMGLLSFMTMVYSGRHFFIGAWKSARMHNTSKDSLIALGSASLWLYSMSIASFPKLVAVLGPSIYFDAACIIIALMNLVTAMEIRVRVKSFEAQYSQSSLDHLVDKLATILVSSVFIIAVFSFLVWYIFSPADTRLGLAIVSAITVLIIVNPYVLAWAIPITIKAAMGRAEAFGALIHHGEALPQLDKLTTIVLNKNGTITETRPSVREVIPAEGFSEEEILTYALSAESSSQHPLAQAIVEYARAKGHKKKLVSAFQRVPGQGIEAVVEGQVIRIGNTRLMMEKGIDGGWLGRKAAELTQLEQTPMFISFGKEIAGLISVAYTVKPDSAAAIESMHRAGLKVVLMTGDNIITANVLGKRLGVDDIIADVLPEEKLAAVQHMQKSGERVGMVGDAISEAQMLACADVGFDIDTDSDVNTKSADITLMNASLHSVVDAIEISKTSVRNIKQNLYGVFIYNSLAIPIAAGILYPWFGLDGLLNPIIATAAMAISSMLVVSHANRLRMFKPRHP